MTANHDDMATLLRGSNADDNYVKLAWAGRQEESGQLVDDLGYRWGMCQSWTQDRWTACGWGGPFAWRYVDQRLRRGPQLSKHGRGLRRCGRRGR